MSTAAASRGTLPLQRSKSRIIFVPVYIAIPSLIANHSRILRCRVDVQYTLTPLLAPRRAHLANLGRHEHVYQLTTVPPNIACQSERIVMAGTKGDWGGNAC